MKDTDYKVGEYRGKLTERTSVEKEKKELFKVIVDGKAYFLTTSESRLFIEQLDNQVN